MCNACAAIDSALLLERLTKSMFRTRMGSEGEEDTLKRVTRAGIPVAWQERLKLELQLRDKVRDLYSRLWMRIANSQLRITLAEARRSPTDQFEHELLTLTTDYVNQGYFLGANDAITGVNTFVGFDVANIRGPEFLRQHAAEFASKLTGQMSQTAINTIYDVIGEGMRQGWSIRDMQEALKAKAEVALGRAELIARTTVVKAYNLGKMQELEELDINEVELVGCDPECEECQTVISGNPYAVSEAESIETGLHPNHTGSWVPTSASIDRALKAA